MTRKRYQVETTTLDPIPDDARAELEQYLTSLAHLQSIVETLKAGTTKTELLTVLDEEEPRKREFENILSAGGIYVTTTNETAVLINRDLDGIEAELTSFNAWIARNNPKA